MINISPYKESIYKINTHSGSGTAFYLEDWNLIVTAASAVEDFATVELLNFINKKVYCKVVYTDALQNIALLMLSEYMQLQPCRWRKTHN